MRMPTVIEWINVHDEMPPEGDIVLVIANDIVRVWTDFARVYICPEYECVTWEDLDHEDYVPIVTHWAKIPDPPKEEI
jgi:hypothetical protein